MDANFWQERWQLGQIGFHQPDYHPALARYWRGLGVPAGERIFVPLCGRSLDMAWFARQGHQVLGVELSPIAAVGFFKHESLGHVETQAGAFTRYAAGPYEILQGDFFDLTPSDIGHSVGWYDRAALVALPPDMRRRYVEQLAKLLPPGARGLLISHAYQQEKMSGPPFSVPADEVQALFAADFDLQLVEEYDVLAAVPRFIERGLDWLTEMIFTLTRR